MRLPVTQPPFRLTNSKKRQKHLIVNEDSPSKEFREKERERGRIKEKAIYKNQRCGFDISLYVIRSPI